MEITVNSPKTGKEGADGKIVPRSMTVNYNFGKDHDEAVELFGKPVIFSKFIAQASTDLGNSVRKILNEPEKGEKEVLAFIEKWRPGVVTRGAGRKKEVSTSVLVADLKNPETTQERKIEIKTILEIRIKEVNEARAALKEAG